MKILKTSVKHSKVDRKLISGFGQTVYHASDVKSVFIRVDFNDGSSMSYSRDEDDDEFNTVTDTVADKEIE